MAGEQRVLVVAAHPDDEILGCGATIAWHRDRGDKVAILILGEGITSRYATRSEARRVDVERLHANTARAARCVGVGDLEIHTFPDNRFDAIPLLEIVQRIEQSVERFRPDTVYTHSEADLNIDHELTARAVLTAARPAPGAPVRRVYSFEVVSATDWRGSRRSSFAATRYVDATRTLSRKLSALRCYRGEMRPFPHSRSVEAVKALAVRRGAEAGLRAAEAFEVLREIVTR